MSQCKSDGCGEFDTGDTGYCAFHLPAAFSQLQARAELAERDLAFAREAREQTERTWQQNVQLKMVTDEALAAAKKALNVIGQVVELKARAS